MSFHQCSAYPQAASNLRSLTINSNRLVKGLIQLILAQIQQPRIFRRLLLPDRRQEAIRVPLQRLQIHQHNRRRERLLELRVL